MTIFLVNLFLVIAFVYLISRQQNEEFVYDEDFFLQNPSALEEYQQMPIDFQHAFFRKHKEWIKEKYMRGESYILGYCPNKEVRRAWLSEFMNQKNMNNTPTPSS
ncbi:hypothetical protein ACFU8X_02585 [Brevibacillus porteri]|jgi:hypothetical protein|uniref:Uncharacterized protein n=6 Tax=Brevibacillus TaxID=55080 RepID=A0A0J6BSE3_BREBE|nr:MULTISPECIES: hypothetical protein [Brevibacillus]MDF2682461.1 hypothetical protein [Brevibacillus sp.]MED1914177.1 hypothetical protein [Bacillus thuringiensis]ASJ54939.1 hypothetical protein BP422_16030 [Brevibacillus formosus]AWX57346.1 hypothetical protein AB432_020875 [Brevibacillus brevis]EJL31661.1 hypothetical protein PMI05_00617 [Brevibacillus sp. BC25]